MPSSTRISVLVFAVLIMTAAVTSATQVLHKSIEQIGQESSKVVLGQVAGIHSFWNDKHTKIFTEILINVEQTFKGSQTGTVRILQLGGTVDNVRVTVHGGAYWTEQEEVVVFLEPYINGSHAISGFTQGKFEVSRDRQTGQVFIERPALEGAELVGAPGGDIASTRLEKMPLERFLERALGNERRPKR